MRRPALVLASLLLSATTAGAQPAPRVALDIDLSPLDGFGLNGYAPPGRLAISADGTHHVVLHEYWPALDPVLPARAARLWLAAVNAEGGVKFKVALPVRRAIGPNGFQIDSMGVVPARSGDIAVFVSGGNPAAPPEAGPRAAGTMLRLAPNGQLKKETTVGPPHPLLINENAPEPHYELEGYLPTPDNALLMAGGFGPGPFGWWLGKFSLDGVRIWQAGPGRGYPERVAGIAQRPDGTTTALVQEVPPGMGMQNYIHRYGVDGSPTAHIRLVENYGYAAAVLRRGNLFVIETNDPQSSATLVHLGDFGHVIGRAPWRFARTSRMIADGEGFAAIVAETYDADAPQFIVRADAKGTIRWKSPAVEASEIALAPNGRIAALVWSQKRAALHLTHYADP